ATCGNGPLDRLLCRVPHRGQTRLCGDLVRGWRSHLLANVGKPNEYMAMFVALTLVTFGTMAFLGPNEAFAASYSVWGWLFTFLLFFGTTASVLFFYLFPDGRFVPRWTLLLAFALVVVQVHSFFLPDLPLLQWLNVPGQTENVFFLASIMFAQ